MQPKFHGKKLRSTVPLTLTFSPTALLPSITAWFGNRDACKRICQRRGGFLPPSRASRAMMTGRRGKGQFSTTDPSPAKCEKEMKRVLPLSHAFSRTKPLPRCERGGINIVNAAAANRRSTVFHRDTSSASLSLFIEYAPFSY